jgi:hypothetical protein
MMFNTIITAAAFFQPTQKPTVQWMVPVAAVVEVAGSNITSVLSNFS